MKQWYYVKNNEKNGPISEEELIQNLNKGIIDSDTLVWSSGMPDWQKIKAVPTLNTHNTPPILKDKVNTAFSSESTREAIYAGFWLRTGAMLIDIIVMFLALFFFGIFFFLMSSTSDPDEVEGWSTIIAFIGGWLYYAIWESSEYQATLGKLALGLKVTDESGNKIDFGKATGRYFGKIVSGLILYIGYLMAAFTKKKQALHDMMAGCLVVKK